MRFWILQSNPDRIDLDAYLASRPDRIRHGVRRYPDLIKPGDRTFLWRAKGHSRLTPGIVALATVVEAAEFRLSDKPQIFPAGDKPKLRVVLDLEEVRLTPAAGMITREEVRRLPEMRTHAIVTSNTGSDFPLTEAQAQELMQMWNASVRPQDV